MTEGNTGPKLHNAMWPGLVGKGGDAEPPIDLETMLDLTAAAEVNGTRFDGVDLSSGRPAHQHRRQRRRHRAAGRWSPHAISSSVRWWRRSGHQWRRFGNGQRRGPRPLRGDGRQGQPHRQPPARAGRAPTTASCASTRRLPSKNGRRTLPGTPASSPRPFVRPVTWPRATASGWRRKERSAGADA